MIAFLNLFLKILFFCKGKFLTLLQVVITSFNGPIYKGIFPDIRSLLPVPNFPNMINPTQIANLRNLSHVTFQARSAEYALKSAHKRAIVLR